mmetsp:Transcript_169062/g.537172  ORF Transcript_169062/g.537172 Transcript_169062/m.537172 type:complete len:178 (+) Transcript_169062:66-599(+)
MSVMVMMMALFAARADADDTMLPQSANSAQGAGALQIVLESGRIVEIDARDGGMMPLMKAAGCGGLHCAKVLLEAGADVNLKGAAPAHGDLTALTQAVYRYSQGPDRRDMVELLIKQGADVSSLVGDHTPLMRALGSHQEPVAILADVAVKNPVGETSLDVARWLNFMEVEQMLSAQ